MCRSNLQNVSKIEIREPVVICDDGNGALLISGNGDDFVSICDDGDDDGCV